MHCLVKKRSFAFWTLDGTACKAFCTDSDKSEVDPYSCVTLILHVGLSISAKKMLEIRIRQADISQCSVQGTLLNSRLPAETIVNQKIAPILEWDLVLDCEGYAVSPVTLLSGFRISERYILSTSYKHIHSLLLSALG